MSARGVWALVPAKSFDRGKSRLEPVLAAKARAAFARSVFDHVLDVLSRSRALDGVLVTTDSRLVAEAARKHGASARMDAPGETTLAAVVDAGLADLAARGARAGLVMMADLPRLQPDDVGALVTLLERFDAVIVRAEDGRHTNALGLAPPGRMPTAFGRADSFDAHVRAARAAGLRLSILDNENIAFDVDGPDEYARLVSAPAHG